MSKFNSLITKLREVFQIDRPDLDFGIYRIMNARAEQITRYLEHDLREKVTASLGDGQSAQLAETREKLTEAKKNAKALDMDPDKVPAVKELQTQLADLKNNDPGHEDAIFSHLTTFFSRYYEKGDYISQRRYKGDTYAIPYSGEEVVLHWANKDQYYIKSGESFTNYSFKLDDGRRVSFQLLTADTAKDNRKDNDENRLFALIPKGYSLTKIDEDGEEITTAYEPIVESGEKGAGKSDLIIHFTYQGYPKSVKKKEKNAASLKRILAHPLVTGKWNDLHSRKPTEKNKSRTLLEYHLTTYTEKNTSDYFIHKDLGRFLRNELDFYIKNEVMHLDDVQNADTFDAIKDNLRLIQTLREIALDLIRFLAQLEDFQKKLWLKKKFVTQTDYCLTLDSIPEKLYPEIAANDIQREEWIKLFAIDEMELKKGDLVKEDTLGYSEPLTAKFLQQNPHLVLDTVHFSEEFKAQLLDAIPNLDESLDGLVIHSENFQALNLLQERYREKVKCVYIDPPYNTGGDGFAYRDAYKSSSWLSMTENRISLAHNLIGEQGVFYSSIDECERKQLETILDGVFGHSNRVEEIVWAQNTTKNQSPTYSTNHEYVPVYAKNLGKTKSDFTMFRERKAGLNEILELAEELQKSYPEIEIIQAALRNLFKKHKEKLKKEKITNDEWKGIYNYNRAEYRDSDGKYVAEKDAKKNKAIIWIWREVDTSMPQVKQDSQKAEFRDPSHPTYRFYEPSHPLTKQKCPAPKRGWSWPYEPHGKQKSCFVSLYADNRISWGDDENKVPQRKSFLHEVKTNVAKSVMIDFTDGEKELEKVFGRSRVFGGPKPTTLPQRFCDHASLRNGIFCDFFAGSGTSGHAVLSYNRLTESNAKYILVEMGDHFDTVLRPRLKKVAYSSDWKGGKPTTRDTGISHGFKYLRLESYEDVLNNLRLPKDESDLLATAMGQDYQLSYMLDVETRASLLSVADFQNPFDYQLNIATDSSGASEPRPIDLIETFNYLIGLTVEHYDRNLDQGYAKITGTLPTGEKTLILWRDCEKIAYEELDQLCKKWNISPHQKEYDLVYLNGDHNLPNVLEELDKEGGSTRELRLRQIEPEFLERMFGENS